MAKPDSDHPDDEGIVAELRTQQRGARRHGFYGRIVLTIEYQDGYPAYREMVVGNRKNIAKPAGKR